MNLNLFKNYFSTLLFICLAGWLYFNLNFYTDYVGQTKTINFADVSFAVENVFYAVAGLYVVFLVPFYLKYHEPSKARHVIRYMKKVFVGRNDFSERERVSVLAWVVKLFFVPLMLTWLTGHIFSLINNYHWLFTSFWELDSGFVIFFDNNIFWTAFSTILFADVLFFTIGYLIESPGLKNTIKSVEPTFIGWAVTILCYPPLNSIVSWNIGWFSTDFPKFENPFIHLSMNLAILVLMGIYAWASVALNFKASNLTNRWIIAKWPYAYVRHPAYICKNMAWWIGALPMAYVAITSDQVAIGSVLLATLGWSLLYYLRAMTEENHLSLDPDYLAYKKQVKWRFIPKVW